jgi:hypothetical protein
LLCRRMLIDLAWDYWHVISFSFRGRPLYGPSACILSSNSDGWGWWGGSVDHRFEEHTSSLELKPVSGAGPVLYVLK